MINFLLSGNVVRRGGGRFGLNKILFACMNCDTKSILNIRTTVSLTLYTANLLVKYFKNILVKRFNVTLTCRFVFYKDMFIFRRFTSGTCDSCGYHWRTSLLTT